MKEYWILNLNSKILSAVLKEHFGRFESTDIKIIYKQIALKGKIIISIHEAAQFKIQSNCQI